jgi:hypothetical protein
MLWLNFHANPGQQSAKCADFSRLSHRFMVSFCQRGSNLAAKIVILVVIC